MYDDSNNKKLLDEYDAVLNNYVEDGILEPISLDSTNIEDHVWIPHRLDIKIDEHSTTKLRVVLDCSLNFHGQQSINEAAFPGVDLMTNLVELLIKVRGGDIIVMSDIIQAFLTIKLALESDKNNFNVIWKGKSGGYITFRYTSIVSGLVCSSFILQQVP